MGLGFTVGVKERMICGRFITVKVGEGGFFMQCVERDTLWWCYPACSY